MNKLRLFLLMFSSNVTPPSTPTPTPAVVTVGEATTLLTLCYYYTVLIITIAAACSHIQYNTVTISMDLCSEHASFFSLISKVLLIISSRSSEENRKPSGVVWKFVPPQIMFPPVRTVFSVAPPPGWG